MPIGSREDSSARGQSTVSIADRMSRAGGGARTNRSAGAAYAPGEPALACSNRLRLELELAGAVGGAIDAQFVASGVRGIRLNTT